MGFILNAKLLRIRQCNPSYLMDKEEKPHDVIFVDAKEIFWTKSTSVHDCKFPVE